MLRDEGEIVRAHDLLLGILLEEIELDLPEVVRNRLIAAAGVLCWVLRHDHNKAFAENLALLESLAQAAGYQLRAVN